LATADGRDLVGAAFEVRRHGANATASALVAFGAAATHAVSVPETRATLAEITHGSIVPGDDRVARPAVELVTRGVLDAGSLSSDAQVELAALRGGRGTGEALWLPDRAGLDARHEYLAAALSDPQGARAKELGARLASVAG